MSCTSGSSYSVAETLLLANKGCSCRDKWHRGILSRHLAFESLPVAGIHVTSEPRRQGISDNEIKTEGFSHGQSVHWAGKDLSEVTALLGAKMTRQKQESEIEKYDARQHQS